jgi:hypothetical protein
MIVRAPVKSKTSKRAFKKMNLKKYLTEEALSSVSGAPTVYASHTDGSKCDTSKGCNCGT